MSRQSISFTKPNDEWLKAQVDNEEYSSKSELINDLIRQARKQQVQVDWIRNRLDQSEQSGFTNDTKEDILKKAKTSLNGCPIAQRPFSFESVDDIKKGYRRCVCGSDCIYYRINNGSVEIMAIIGRQELNNIL